MVKISFIHIYTSDAYITGNVGEFISTAGTHLDLTCNYNVYDGVQVKSLTWTLNQITVSDNQENRVYITDEETTCGYTRRSFYNNPHAIYNKHTGVYGCKVEFEGSTDTVEDEKEFYIFYAASKTNHNVMAGDTDVELSCTVYGAESNSIKWINELREMHNDPVEGSSVNTYNQQSREQQVILKFSGEITTQNAKTYYCYASWSSNESVKEGEDGDTYFYSQTALNVFGKLDFSDSLILVISMQYGCSFS